MAWSPSLLSLQQAGPASLTLSRAAPRAPFFVNTVPLSLQCSLAQCKACQSSSGSLAEASWICRLLLPAHFAHTHCLRNGDKSIPMMVRCSSVLALQMKKACQEPGSRAHNDNPSSWDTRAQSKVPMRPSIPSRKPLNTPSVGGNCAAIAALRQRRGGSRQGRAGQQGGPGCKLAWAAWHGSSASFPPKPRIAAHTQDQSLHAKQAYSRRSPPAPPCCRLTRAACPRRCRARARPGAG